MLAILGFIIIIFSVFGGFVIAGGHVSALIQPVELLMIGGAAFGTFLIANNTKIIATTIKEGMSILKPNKYAKPFFIELLSLFYELTTKIRKDGVIAIEADVENPKDSALFSKYKKIQANTKVMEFLCDHLRLIISGRVDIHHLEEIIDFDIETFEAEAELPISAITRVADGMPAFGIVAAVMGVVHTMGSIGIPPEQLGELIAKALVGTFLGILIAYGFISPVANALDNKRHAEMRILLSIKVVLIASSSNIAPPIAVEMARKVLYSNLRPNSKQLEEILKDVKSNKAGAAA